MEDFKKDYGLFLFFIINDVYVIFGSIFLLEEFLKNVY